MENSEGQGNFFSRLNLPGKLRDFLSSSRRIFIISKKPSREEFTTMVKVTGIGIIIIAIIGFIVIITFTLTGIGF
ncbi:MAG TPA: protein translocase SEC61 complex subunit gamma [archaeon]|nr:protein translocase SEC61 complex subunit gamma [archaeon]